MFCSLAPNIYAQGHTLFQTHDNLEHLAMMTRILGELPHHLVKIIIIIQICQTLHHLLTIIILIMWHQFRCDGRKQRSSSLPVGLPGIGACQQRDMQANIVDLFPSTGQSRFETFLYLVLLGAFRHLDRQASIVNIAASNHIGQMGVFRMWIMSRFLGAFCLCPAHLLFRE